MTIGQEILASFGRIASRDGGSVSILSEDEKTIRLAYQAGAPECADGTCVLPHAEFEEMVNEWLSRRAPGVRLLVRLMKAET